jgi:hypothetical protein
MDQILDLLAPLGPQIITALPLIPTSYKLLVHAKPLPACCVLISHFLATASNSFPHSGPLVTAARSEIVVNSLNPNWQLTTIHTGTRLPFFNFLSIINSEEQSRAVAYCWQPASTVTPGIEPRWDPRPYIYSMSRLLFFPSFVVPPSIKREGLDFFYNWCSLTTPYSTRGHIKVADIYISYIIHKTQTDTKFYYIQGHLSMQDSAAAYASTYLNLRNGN